MFNRIRIELTTWYVLVLLVIIGVTTTVTYFTFSRSIADEVDDSLRNSATGIAAQLSDDVVSALPTPVPSPDDGDDQDDRDDDEDEDENEDHEGLEFFSHVSGDTFYLVLSPEGAPLINPLNINVSGLLDADAVNEAIDKGPHFETVDADGESIRLYTYPVSDEDHTVAVVQVGRSLSERDRQVNNLLLVLLISGGGGLALAAIGGLFVAARALRPIRESFGRQRAFVADASHELRTPITLIRGNAEVLASDPAKDSADDRESLEEIVAQTAQMERLVSDLSQLARMDEGRLDTAREHVDLGPLADRVAREGRQLARERDIDLPTSSEPGLIVSGDEPKLHQLLLGLVENAVRYTPDGGTISIEADRSGTSAAISVRDTGPGIAPEHLPHIFERFYRTDEARSRAEGGTGLGLAIAKGIAEAHGGSIAVESKLGRGTTFTVRLPLER